MTKRAILITVFFLQLYHLTIAQSLIGPTGIDEYWSTVPVFPSTSGLDGLVPTERSRIIGIGTELLDGNSTVTVQSLGGLSGILSIQKGSVPFSFGILSQVFDKDVKAFSSVFGGCESFHILGSGHVVGKSLKITEQGWCDYVFEPDYKLMSLQDVKKYINTNKHLPEVGSKTQVELAGVKVFEMNKLLLKKIEELTLHLISKQEELDILKTKFEK